MKVLPDCDDKGPGKPGPFRIRLRRRAPVRCRWAATVHGERAATATRLVRSDLPGYHRLMAQITPTQATAYLARWREVNRREAADLRTTPLEVKFRQLCALTASRAVVPADPDRGASAALVAERWNRIRTYYGD